MFRRSLNPPRTSWIAALLAASVLLVALLVVHAAFTASSHRAVAEAVLRDYAGLAGDELLRRVAAEVGYYGHLEALGLLRRVASDPQRGIDEQARAGSARQQRSMELIRWAFLLQVADRELAVLGERRPVGLSPELTAWLADAGPRALAGTSRGDFAVLQRADRTFVVSPIDSDEIESDEIDSDDIDGDDIDSEKTAEAEARAASLIGFELDRSRLEPWVSQALDRRPLLPPSLGSGELGNEVLFLRLTDGAGEEILRRGERYASALRVERTLPEDYLKPLEGLTVQAAVDPAAASKLVIGGLPRSRLPVLVGLVVLTAGLLTAAVVMLRRERALIRLRTDFVSRVSHELRTPLTQIRMFAETLRLGRVRDVKERDLALEVIDRESRRLSVLVENVLQFSRADRGVPSLVKERFRIRLFLEALIEEVGPLLFSQGDSAGARIRIDADPSIEIEADADAIRQILLNLLDNAAKYGPPSQLVIVGAEAGEGVTRLWVDDEGPGIDPSDRDRVWQPFRRASHGGEVSGTGIGLSVVRELIEQHGGRCAVNVGDRGGARIVVELPDDLQERGAS